MARFTQPTPAQEREIDTFLQGVANTKIGGKELLDDKWMHYYSVEGDDKGEGLKAMNDPLDSYCWQ